MHTLKSKIDFDPILDLWLQNLEQYDDIQLLAKPSPGSWSMGQLYVHLLQSTRYFIKQLQTAASNDNNINEQPFFEAEAMFSNDELPDTFLEGPPSNANTPQSVSKGNLTIELKFLKNELKDAQMLASKTQFRGRTKHFGLGYFSADQWLQFAHMHLRHHLRQKRRLDDFLGR